MRRFIVAGGLALTATLTLAGPALADDCANLSRTTTHDADFTTKGRWTLFDTGEDVGKIWAFDKPGEDAVLLDGSHACTFTRLNAQSKNDGSANGIWSEECFEEAVGGAP